MRSQKARSNKRHKRRREDILRLRRAGLSYRQIQKELGCSRSTISYHCGKNKSEMTRVKSQKPIPLCKKLTTFKSRWSKEAWKKFRSKIKCFKKRKNLKYRNSWRINNISKNYNCEDVVNKVGKRPVCYLTGVKINLDDASSYSLDHINPTSRGGTNDLSNLGICINEANQAKGSLTVQEFYDLCEKVLAWRDKKRARKKQKKSRKAQLSS